MEATRALVVTSLIKAQDGTRTLYPPICSPLFWLTLILIISTDDARHHDKEKHLAFVSTLSYAVVVCRRMQIFAIT